MKEMIIKKENSIINMTIKEWIRAEDREIIEEIVKEGVDKERVVIKIIETNKLESSLILIPILENIIKTMHNSLLQ
jgi:hypothetical protein